MKKYFIHTYGCQMNVHESEKIAGILKNKGYEEASNITQADIIVFNTCCIRESAEAKILGHIGETKRLKKNNPDLIVAICGCMTQQENVGKKIRSRFPHVGIILGTSNLHLLGEKIDELKTKESIVEISQDFLISDNVPLYRTSGVNAWVNIIYGCNNFCTYCIVPYVRGRERSRKKDEILKECRELIEEGYKEITLLGQNVNSYGKEPDEGWRFADLLDAVASIEGDFRIRFMTSHPKDFNHEILEVMKAHENICKYIHLPFQSGSNKVLKSMNRKYTREKYLDIIRDIRETLGNDAGISSDALVGFAGETEEDFQETMSLIEEVRFTGLYSFIYSRRKGTPGYAMENQVPLPVKRERIMRLQALQGKITEEISENFVGKKCKILVEGLNDKYRTKTYCGRTDSGRLVNIVTDKELIGKTVNVVITKHNSATLWGNLIDE